MSALNIAGDDASLPLAATVVQDRAARQPRRRGHRLPAVPLGELHGQAAARAAGRLGRRGAAGTKAAAVERCPGRGGSGSGWRRGCGAAGCRWTADRTALAARAPTISADGVVLAVPPEAAAQAVPAGRRGRAGHRRGPVERAGHLADRQRARDLRPAGHPAAVRGRGGLAGAVGVRQDRARPGCGPGSTWRCRCPPRTATWTSRPRPLREQFLPALAELFPAARDARVTDFFVTRERRATFRQVPGLRRLRPGAATWLPGLVLAGAWTDTGWPDTMEGAVRSGLTAARVAAPGRCRPGRLRAGPRPRRRSRPVRAAASPGTGRLGGRERRHDRHHPGRRGDRPRPGRARRSRRPWPG